MPATTATTTAASCHACEANLRSHAHTCADPVRLLAEARGIANELLAYGASSYADDASLWAAYGALDAVLLTADEQREDYARKDAVFAALRRNHERRVRRG
jgi:hypothetical protein